MKSKPVKKLLLRLDPKLWEELKMSADKEMRSINSQIEYELTKAMKKNKQLEDE